MRCISRRIPIGKANQPDELSRSISGSATTPVPLRRLTSTKAAGEVLTAKQAPHRPGIIPALGLRADGDDVFILSQTAFEYESGGVCLFLRSILRNELLRLPSRR